MSTIIVHAGKEEYDVYIGRPSKWGNPFKIGEDGTRQQVIYKYYLWVREQPELMASLHELYDKRLGCWCGEQLCHGHALLMLMAEAKDTGTLFPQAEPS